MVDVAASMGWMQPALAAMELAQMTVQAVWEGRDPLVKQVPHLGTNTMLPICQNMNVETVFDVIDMEDTARSSLLKDMPPRHIADIAAYVNRYPNIEVEHEITDADQITAGELVYIRVSLDRDWDDDSDNVPGPVIAPFFPYSRTEGWWLVVGDPRTQTLLVVKRVSVGRHLDTRVEFMAPEREGPCKLKMFLMCDAYLGCDQEFDVEINVLQGDDEASEMDED
ncbi:Pre-mRNA splicing [Coemansia sp. RSA 1591]|nr:Pre-mRNA splicing [Coemansia sp. RSA 1591]KAJ1775842.1 Pre-mRNA splicing [Coemansia sp. RSA 1938]